MIELDKIINDEPHNLFKSYYYEALKLGQESIEVISVSSFGADTNEIESRYVNLKYIIDNEWIFFSNYNSKKANNFKSLNQISVLSFWNKLNLQIRIKAKIRKSSHSFSDDHYQKRALRKNVIAHSSNQSKKTKSHDEVITKYKKYSLNTDLISARPKYWGGYSFFPYYFEFWEGHESRINKREVFNKTDGVWKHSFLQP
jgi:pyridoxamine 5'-phosphate oxidase